MNFIYRRTLILASGIVLFLYCLLNTVPVSAQLPETHATESALLPNTVSDKSSDVVSSPLLSHHISNPETPVGAWVRGEIPVASVTTPPLIDGSLNDECWKTATHAAGFFRYGGTSGIKEQTEAWVCADKHHLYVAFHCLDSEPVKIRTSETQRGGNLENDDTVTVMVDSQHTRRKASWFYVSANGTQTEELEGGTAGNITWAGDWKAVSTRCEDGWICEIAIPFRLLRYPKGATTFGMLLMRRLARETNPECWPYVPPEGQSWENRIQYLNDFTQLSPPFFAPKPTFLPYILASAGDGTIARQGMDIKYPLSTTLTGLVTIHPDFRTIEQQVTGINFSYNERFIPDNRPFFAEGAEFLPNRELFYSQRIPTLDEGIKVAGKNGLNTIGLVTAAQQEAGQNRTSYAFNFARDIGQLSNLGFATAGDNQAENPSNRVARLFGEYGWKQGKTRYSLDGNTTASWQSGKEAGGMQTVNFRLHNSPGKPGFRATYSSIDPDFESALGLVPELDRRGEEASLFQFNNFDKGPIEFYEVDSLIDQYHRHDGTFFRRGMGYEMYLQTRRGYGWESSMTRENRQEDADNFYHDYNLETGFFWNQRSLFQGGGIVVSRGKAAGDSSRFQNIQQGFLLARPLTLKCEASRQILGDETTTQIIVTGTYRLDASRTISGRLVRQDGANTDPFQSIGVVRGTNLYVAFSQRVRSGSDLFILLGDPNSSNSKGQITIKMLRPY